MAEIDTRPLESVQEAVTIFEPRSDRLNRFSPDRNVRDSRSVLRLQPVGKTQEEEIVTLNKELASCKLQLEAKENETKQATLKLEALQKAMQELSDKYDRACLDSHGRIAQLEVENSTIRIRQSETAHECKALRDELAVVLKEVEMMEARAIAERESTKEALTRILQLNETVLSSAVAAVRAEEERSVFFQEVTLELFNSDKNLEVIRRQMEMVEGMERELLAKTVEIEYLLSELNQAMEKYVSSHEVCDVTADIGGCKDLNDRTVQVCETGVINQEPDATADICGCKDLEDRPVQVCETGVINQDPEAEFTFQHTPEEPKLDASFVLESSIDDFQSVHSDGKDISNSMPEHVAGYQEPSVAPAPTPREGNSGTCVAAKENVSNDEDEFYTKELDPEQGDKLLKLDGYDVLVAKGEADAVNDKMLEAAREEISDLRFSLEEAVRRAELAEEAKAALERELREEIRNKHPSRRRAASDSEDTRRPAREGPPPTPALPRQMPPRGPRSARPGGEDMPTPRCVTLGKVLNMKYK